MQRPVTRPARAFKSVSLPPFLFLDVVLSITPGLDCLSSKIDAELSCGGGGGLVDEGGDGHGADATLNNKPTAYVCQNYLCKKPSTKPDELAKQLIDR